MSEWIKAVTHPLGLAGFALFLVFGALGKIKSKDERRWLARLGWRMPSWMLTAGLPANVRACGAASRKARGTAGGCRLRAGFAVQ